MTDSPVCIVCGRTNHNAQYAPWCGRNCKNFAKRRSTVVDYDLLARRQLIMQNDVVRGLVTEKRALQRRAEQAETAVNDAHTEASHLNRQMAHLREENAVLRWYAGDAVGLLADQEIRRRHGEGRKLTDPGAHFVIALRKRKRAS